MKRVYTKMPFLSAIIFCLFLSANLDAQIEFTNQNALLNNPNFHSGVAIVVADMNNDRLDDIVRLSQGRYLTFEYQNPGGMFITDSIMSVSNSSQWAMCVGDVDNNGYNDVLCGDTGNSRLIKANSDGSDYTLSIMPGSDYFAQGSNFADINNDGHVDAFICNDNGESGIFANDGTGVFSKADDWIDMSTDPVSDNSGNYGSVWTDFDNDGDLDLYIAKCRQNVGDPTDPRRINALFVNDGNNNFTESADIYGLKIGWQSWTSDFQDIDNDGDFDVFITNHDHVSQLLENDGNGFFKDITEGAEINLSGTPIQGVMRDFDNDGFVDVLVAGDNNAQSLFLNDGDKTFTKVENVFDDNDMESYAIGDLNHDGFLDIYAGYAQVYTTPTNIDDVIWMNSGNDNNFFAVDLKGNTSNRNAIGAKIEIYGDWGVQVREVRAGESYGIGNSMTQHFGLGLATEVDYVVVKWPSGKIDVIFNPDINDFLLIEEGSCDPVAVEIEPTGNTVFCTGENVELTAPAGYSYYWSNGENTQNITVTDQGNYNVIVEDNGGCFGVSQYISVIVDPVEIPEVAIDGDLEFCQGGSVILTSSEAEAYEWSNGETTQSIEVTETGNYFVTAQGLCEGFESTSVPVDVLAAPVPVTDDVQIDVPGPAMLIAEGENPQWWDAPVDGNLLWEGDTLSLNQVDVTTSYWVESVSEYGLPEANVGMEMHEGGEYSGSTFNGGIVFDCFVSFTLKSVLVYTDTEGERLIELRDDGGTVLNSILVNIPVTDSEGIRIDLDFEILPGENYQLTTNGDQNEIALGYETPRLKRSNSGVDYGEYFVEDVVDIKTSLGAGGSSRYYYFFDWEIQPISTFCVSERVEAQVIVGPVSTFNIGDSEAVQLFPNPSNGNVNLMMDFNADDAELKLTDLSGKTVFAESIGQIAKKDVHQLNLAHLAKGVYFIQLLVGDDVYNGKIIFQ